MIPLRLRTEFLELYKCLKAAGLSENGAAAKHFISEGRVKVDGKIETRKGCKIRAGQQIEFDGKIILAEG